ncbi:MAG: GNAT family N-acetyltransferase [Defluviitaleaceae bacterium]|nr:GNAT family N-acetyltransferase [Defluviitaleaceae bacterium]MCL2239661.1 GNAT family N-acetyltransferase [Defluviitaleaceae bacterium]
MEYKYAYQMDAGFIADILAIDAAVYEPTARGTMDSLLDRYNANRESFILACQGPRIVGYVAFFPIEKHLTHRILNESIPFDDNIKATDILPGYPRDVDVDLLLISIAIFPEFNGMGIGRELMGRYFGFVGEKIQGGCRITNTYSYAVTDAGARVLGKFGFDIIKHVKYQGEDADVKLMHYRH